MKKSELIKNILEALEKGLVVAVVGFSRGSLHKKDYLLRRMCAELVSSTKREIPTRSLKRLFLQRAIVFTRDRDVITLSLTEKGKKRLISYKLDEISLNSSVPWDGVWRVVIFDIPEDSKSFRDVFRKAHLLKMGFMQIQQSVFVTPFPCRDQIDFIAEFFGIRSCVRVIEATSFDGEKEFKKYFNLA